MAGCQAAVGEAAAMTIEIQQPACAESAHRSAAGVLRSAIMLLTAAKPEGGPDARPLDEGLMSLLADIDDEALMAAAPDIAGLSDVLPVFHDAVADRCRAVLERTAAGAAPALVERRARQRDPVADAENPLTRARRAEPEELMHLAAMPAMPERLADIITSRIHVPAIVVALRNPSAVFSASSLLMLAELAAGDRSLGDALVDHSKLPDAAIDRLLPLLRRDACARLIMSSGERAAPLPSVQRVDATPIAFEAIGNRPLACGLAAATPAIAARAADVLAVMDATVAAMLGAKLDHACAVLMRALDASEPALGAILDMRAQDGLRCREPSPSAFAAFRRFDVAEASAMTQLIDERLRWEANFIRAAA